MSGQHSVMSRRAQHIGQRHDLPGTRARTSSEAAATLSAASDTSASDPFRALSFLYSSLSLCRYSWNSSGTPVIGWYTTCLGSGSDPLAPSSTMVTTRTRQLTLAQALPSSSTAPVNVKPCSEFLVRPCPRNEAVSQSTTMALPGQQMQSISFLGRTRTSTYPRCSGGLNYAAKCPGGVWHISHAGHAHAQSRRGR